MSSEITVIIADTDDSRRAQSRQHLEGEELIRLQAESENPEDLLDYFKTLPTGPDVLLMHVNFCGDSLPLMVRSIVCSNPETNIIILSDNQDDARILDALGAGARGHIRLSEIERFLPKAVQKVFEGEAWIPRCMVNIILGRLIWLTRLSSEYEQPDQPGHHSASA